MSLSASLVNIAGPVNWMHPLNKGLRGWWLCVPGLMSGGRWVDLCASVNQHALNGVLTGNAAFSGLQHPGGFGSLAFDGTGDYIDMGSVVANTGEMTATAWIRRGTSAPNYRGIFQNASSSANANFMWYVTSDVGSPWVMRVWWAGGIRATSSGGTLSNETWHHVAFVRSGVAGAWTLTFYVNGEPRGTTSGITTDPTAGTWALQIGRGLFASTDWDGQIDDVRLYNRALSAWEMLTLYRQSRWGYPNLLNRLVMPRLPEVAAGGVVIPVFMNQYRQRWG